MKDYKSFLEKFFTNELSSEEFEKFVFKLKKIIKKVFKVSFSPQIESLFQKFYGQDYLDDLTYELLLRFLNTKDYLNSINYINEKYIFSCAKNLIYSCLSSEFKTVEREINFEDLKIQESLEDEEKIKFEENLPQYTVDYFETYKIYHIIKILKEKLTQKDLKVLCWYIYKQIYGKEFKLDMSKGAIYKRWERLKPKLRDILGEEFIEELTSSKFFELMKSEICKKLDYNLK